VSFASEHSAVEEEQNNLEEEPTATDFVVDKLYEQLIGGFHGCTDQEHQDQRCEHMDAAGDNYYGLDKIFNDSDFSLVLGLREMISTERLARQQTPSAAQWEAMLSGRDRRRRFPMNVCLHKEETQAVEAKVTFDVDSFLGFGSSLGMARRGYGVSLCLSYDRTRPRTCTSTPTSIIHIMTLNSLREPRRPCFVTCLIFYSAGWMELTMSLSMCSSLTSSRCSRSLYR
jgi:hypothetical protein